MRSFQSSFGNSVAVTTAKPISRMPFGLPDEMVNFDKLNISAVLTKNARALHDEIHAATGSSPELITTIMLTTVAGATQCLFDVAHLDIIHCPTSIAGIYVGGAATGKTTTKNQFTQAHSDFQLSESSLAQESYEFRAELKIWEAKEKAIEKKINGSIEDEVALQELKNVYVEHIKLKPNKSKVAANIIHRDVTFPALAKSLETQSACTCWINDEATSTLSDLNRLMPFLNAAWDGAALKRERITSDPIFQPSPRVSISWGMQPRRFKKYVQENGADFIDVGMGARMLIALCRPIAPSAGERTVQVVREARNRHGANLGRIFKRYAEMMKAGCVTREVLTLDPEAGEQFRSTLNWISRERLGQGRLSKIPSFATRMPENILRVAANLHVIEERSGTEIMLDVLQSATQLMIYYAEQHEAIFGDIHTPIEEKHANIVLRYLDRKFEEWEFRQTPFYERRLPVRMIQQYVGTQEFRSSRRNVEAALQVLERERVVEMVYDQYGRILGVTLNDHFFRKRRQSRPSLYS